MNRLSQAQSLYLRQHADNPVDWFPWGEEAFAKAKAEDKPLLISIGYSACHWCHVMAHECFESAYIAALMNRHFVCVKVDREERPDVDQIYMEAVHMLQGSGGWPLNVFCLPDGRPFAGGTYFPPEDRGNGLIPWPQLLMRIADFYQSHRGDLEENASAITSNLNISNQPPGAGEGTLENQMLVSAAWSLCSAHDDEWGGFGPAPKFPPAMSLNFLMALRGSKAAEVDRGGALARRIDLVSAVTLERMARGGLFDQLGGGFARYSVDHYWRIPHFEKMLYDNGLLLSAYSRAWTRSRNPLYASVVEETVEWLKRDMLLSGGAFAASIDADSEGEEGRYYVWTPVEVVAVLGQPDADRFCEAYGISEEGNFEHGTSNPVFETGSPELRISLKPLREKLLAHRQTRVPPGKDTKILTAWNALTIKGLTEAARAFNRPDWFRLALDCARFVRKNLCIETNGSTRLFAVWYDGEGARTNAFLDDYAFLAEACLSLAGTGSLLLNNFENEAAAWLDFSKQLVDTILTRFADPANPGCFFTSDDHETLVTRKKEWFDNALPSGNSSLLHSLGLLYVITADDRYRAVMDSLRTCYPRLAAEIPSSIPHALAAYTEAAIGHAVIKCPPAADISSLRDALATRPWRSLFVLPTAELPAGSGYQLCVGTQCLPPTADPVELANLL